MEEEAPSRSSVAERAGRFRGPAPPHDAAGKETEQPVRRRPPRSLPLLKTHGDEQEPPGVTSPLPTKTKRNSALIEKLQASLALSPSTQLPSPKSPGFRLLLPAFPPPSPGSAAVTALTTSSTTTPTSPVAASPIPEEEGPASFEAPPSVEEGSILSSVNKSRARHSIRRRPPSRRHRNSSSGDEVGVAHDVADKSGGGGGGGEGGGGEEREEEGGGDVFKTEDKTDASTCPGKKQDHKEDREEEEEDEEKEEEGMNRSVCGTKEEDGSLSGRGEEVKRSGVTQIEDGGTERDGEKQETSEEPRGQTSAQ